MMNAIPAKCNACDNSEIISFYDIKNLPLLLFPVDKNERHHIKQSDISSFYCSNCFHIFTFPLSKEHSELIYGNYYRFYPYENLESMHEPYRKPFEDFFENVTRKYFDSITGI